MSILTVANVAKSYGGDLLFSEVAFSLAAGQKMGLIGRNGDGKTTLLRIVLGQETPDPSIVGPLRTVVAPRVALASGRRVGYLRQEAPVHPERTVGEEIEAAFAPLRAVEVRVAAAERAMSDAQDDAALERAMTEYTAASEAFEVLGGYSTEAERDTVLARLGFGPADLTKRVGSCSGGEQTRLALAKLVLTRPDLLVLDEPTNHLDIAATEWLEGFLKNYPGAVLLVSHDRTFLDAVTDDIAELEHGRLTVYHGNYSHYRRQKDERLARQQVMYEQQQAEIERLKAVIKRNMGADAYQSSMRHKMQGRIDRIEKIDPVRLDGRTVRARFDAAGAGRIGREVVRWSGLTKRYGERTLFARLDGVIERGDRVGVVGPNGAGKTTLVRVLLGEEAPTEGTVTFGHNVRRAYFSQHATDDLDPARTVLETLTDRAETFTETEARNYLGRFLFTGDDVHKPVSALSGGEKNKLALARMLLEPCNLLILDEPTNHLDIPSSETLTRMLSDFDGTLLLISHDRYLLNAVTTKTLGLTGDGRAAALHEGNYAAWRDALSAASATMAAAPSAPAAPRRSAASRVTSASPAAAPALNARDLSKARVKAREAVSAAEAAVQSVEARIAAVEADLAAGGNGADPVALAAEHTRLRDELDEVLARWESALAAEEALRS
jgi:ATP-binding cassette subfamily F protein 3